MSTRPTRVASARGVAGKSSRKRTQGRPRQADAEVSKANIRAVTRRLLKERSPAKITQLDIGRAANVDPALIRYYFGDKSSLFREVIRDFTDELSRRRNAIPHDRRAADGLRARLRVWLDFFAETPHYNELVNEEVFYGEAEGARELVAEFVQRAFPDMQELVTAGIRAGELRDVDARFVYIALIALCEFFVTAKALVAELFHTDAVDPDLLHAYGDFAADLLVAGLRRPAP